MDRSHLRRTGEIIASFGEMLLPLTQGSKSKGIPKKDTPLPPIKKIGKKPSHNPPRKRQITIEEQLNENILRESIKVDNLLRAQAAEDNLEVDKNDDNSRPPEGHWNFILDDLDDISGAMIIQPYGAHYDEPHDNNQTQILQDFHDNMDQPPPPAPAPAPSPIQPKQPVANRDPQGEVDMLLNFRKMMDIGDDDFMNPEQWIHCDNDPDYEMKQALRREATSFHANDNQIAQCRPKGSSTLRSRYPKEMLSCPCKCSVRNPSSELGLYATLCRFYKNGWLRNDEPLGLFLPGFSYPGTRNSAAVVGLFKVEHNAPGSAHEFTFSFFDSGTGTNFCCPIGWFYASFLVLVAEGHIPDIPMMAMRVKEQIMLKSNAYSFVNALELNITLHEMALSYRHEIGMHQASTKDPNAKVRVGFKNVDNTNITFKTRDELRLFFSERRLPLCPDTQSLWMQAQTRRIRLLQQENEALRKALVMLNKTT